MTNRENLLSLLNRKGYERVPVAFDLCPSLVREFQAEYGEGADYQQYYRMPWRYVGYGQNLVADRERLQRYHDLESMRLGTVVDQWGIAHEPGSEAAKHMTHMHSPLRSAQSMDELTQYPWPVLDRTKDQRIAEEIRRLREQDFVVHGSIGSPVWENAWYVRGMEPLMMDMMSGDPMAEYILDKITDITVQAAEMFAAGGADILHTGDDIGMQHGIMMSVQLFKTWLLPRITRVIRAAKAIKPDMLVFFHSCGYIIPFIPLLVDAGVDILNPIQPECMSFAQIYREFGDRLSFHGTIGTQTTMPFGTPDQVRGEVFRNLEIAGNQGGLFVAPTHMLEPEVPWQNIDAYVQACQDFTA